VFQALLRAGAGEAAASASRALLRGHAGMAGGRRAPPRRMTFATGSCKSVG